MQELQKGPVAILMANTGLGCQQSVDHLKSLGFHNLIVVGPSSVFPIGGGVIERDLSEFEGTGTEPHQVMNTLMPTLNGRWVYFGFEAEFLYFPFCDSRKIQDLTSFLEDERRQSIFAMRLDLYPKTKFRQDQGMNLKAAYFDTAGFYALNQNETDFMSPVLATYGGLASRYAEYLPQEWQRLNQARLFKAYDGLSITSDFQFSDPEFNSISCPWHHNATICIASFQVSKRLASQSSDTFPNATVAWTNSQKFDWHPDQLLQEGFMEPGQWF